MSQDQWSNAFNPHSNNRAGKTQAEIINEQNKVRKAIPREEHEAFTQAMKEMMEKKQ